MESRASGTKSPATLYFFFWTYSTLLFMVNAVASSEVLREGDVFPECQFVSTCEENEAEFDSHNVTVINSTMGTVEVILKGAYQNSLILTIDLAKRVCDGETGFPYLDYKCKLPERDIPLNCSQQVVTFQYLTTGCYEIYNETNHRLGQYPIETNYSLDNLAKDCSFKIQSSLILERYTRLQMRLEPFLMNNILKFYVAEECRTPNETDFWWKVELKENQHNDVIIERNIPQNGSVNCTILQTEHSHKELHCIIDWEKKTCLMIKRDTSNYPTSFREICPEINYTYIGPLQPKQKLNRIVPVTSLLTTAGVLFLIFIPMIAIGMCFGLKFYYSDSGDSTLGHKGLINTTMTPDMKYKILLLYPQDCELFMVLMKYLKEVLENYNCFEVYDCFDPNRMDEIAHDPQGWISRLLLQKEVRVILSETDAAVFHQAAVNEKCVVTYASPMPYNTLFTYGLKMLLQSIRPQEYNRIFLIRFDDFKQNQGKLHLAHYQRFKLPNHLSNLVSSITNTDIITFGEPEESTSLKRLKYSIEQFEQFRCNNPTYQQKMFNNLMKVV